jgi:hypothetical protein
MKIFQNYEASHKDHESGYAKKAAEMAMAKRIFEVLINEYPYVMWVVDINATQGVAKVRIPDLMGDTLCFKISLNLLSTYDDERRFAIMAGGVILERWRIPRSGVDFGAYLRAMKHRVVNVNDPIPE